MGPNFHRQRALSGESQVCLQNWYLFPGQHGWKEGRQRKADEHTRGGRSHERQSSEELGTPPNLRKRKFRKGWELGQSQISLRVRTGSACGGRV